MGVKYILHGWVVAITELGEGISGLPVTFTWKEVRVVERLEAGCQCFEAWVESEYRARAP